MRLALRNSIDPTYFVIVEFVECDDELRTYDNFLQKKVFIVSLPFYLLKVLIELKPVHEHVQTVLCFY